MSTTTGRLTRGRRFDAAGGAAVADLALAVASRIASRAERGRIYIAPPPPQQSGSTSAVAGYGPYFGSIQISPVKGKASDSPTREGSPAAKADLQRGDVMVSFAGLPIRTI